MPIISRIGRTSWGARATLIVFYALLTAGAVTMVYPLLLMVATSVTGPPDSDQFRLVPEYLYSDDVLFVRYLEEKYLSPDILADHYGIAESSIPGRKLADLRPLAQFARRQVEPADLDNPASPRRRELAEYEVFLREAVPEELLQIGFEQEFGIVRLAGRLYAEFVRDRFAGNLDALNRAYSQNHESFLEARMPHERVSYRNWIPPASQRYDDFLAFKRSLVRSHPFMFQSLNGDVPWRRHLQNWYDARIEPLNREWGTRFTGFDEIGLPRTRPEREAAAIVWDDFVRRKWSPRHMRWDPSVEPVWQRYLRHIYTARAAAAPGAAKDDLDQTALRLLNEAHGKQYLSFEEISLPRPAELTGPLSADFYGFVHGSTSVWPDSIPDTRHVTLLTLAGSYRDWLAERYDRIEDVNFAYQRAYRGWDDVGVPLAAHDWWSVVSNRAGWRWYFATNNFRLVWDRIALRGGALVNTIAFIVLFVFLQLTVSPMCAYALSRFNLRYSNKVLLFLLATMAFPAEVTMIPSFLLLRDMNLLNSFGALLLPGIASGFSIFILKGFFDTLPKELYEAAQLDGAGEMRTFAQITLPLCKPVMAYIALFSFMAAYTTFLFALVICQDSRMWTLMVWIYQLQGTVHESVQIAALLVVMIPTVLVLVLCQRIIMRGIVLPQMH